MPKIVIYTAENNDFYFLNANTLNFVPNLLFSDTYEDPAAIMIYSFCVKSGSLHLQ